MPSSLTIDDLKFTAKTSGLAFAEFITILKGQGFTITVEHYQRLYGLLDKIHGQNDLSSLKFTLCPLFATTSGQQQLFYTLFDSYFQAEASSPVPNTEKDNPSNSEGKVETKLKIGTRKTTFWLLGAFCLLLLGALLFWWLKPPVVGPLDEEIVSEKNIEPFSLKQKEGKSIVIILPGGDAPSLTIWQQYFWHFFIVSAALPFVVLFLLELRRRQGKQMVLQREKNRDKTAKIWHLSIPSQEPVFLRDEGFYTAARKLQQREETDQSRLDPVGTIEATVRNLGVPTWREKQISKPPDYLFLIDIPKHNEHYAQFIDVLVAGLNNEAGFDGFCTVFYYHHDPRICYEAPGGKYHYFSDLVDRFHHCRLVLCGKGEELLDPFTGDPSAWLDIFEDFHPRFFLTTVSPSDWGMTELALAREFFVLPASYGGLRAIPGLFVGDAEQDLKTWVAGDSQERQWDKKLDDPEQLRAWLNDSKLFQWVCCCAVYPDLHWNITLHMGLSLFPDKLNEAALLKLIGLPWFRTGRMSEKLRNNLLQALDLETIVQVRKSIVGLFDASPPPKGSEAADQYGLYLAMDRWAESGKKGKDKELLQQELAAIPTHLLNKDLTFIRLLENRTGVLGFLLPARFYNWFFERGIPLLGLRTRVRALTSFASAGFIAAIMSLFIPELPVAAGGGEISLDFVHIPAGEFSMGSPKDEEGRFSDEMLHAVTLTRDYYLQSTEVTQGQWEQVMGENQNRSSFKACGLDCPVENVSWNDAQEFIGQLNQLSKNKYTFRLPTEAEWEYAARAGGKRELYSGSDILDKVGWYSENSGSATQSVGTRDANAFGLHDMSGNVWEWVQDWYDDKYYANSPEVNPQGPDQGSYRVLRGGSWYDPAWGCRAANRYYWHPDGRNSVLGFRLVLSGQQEPGPAQ